jgi:hypothetical protein
MPATYSSDTLIWIVMVLGSSVGRTTCVSDITQGANLVPAFFGRLNMNDSRRNFLAVSAGAVAACAGLAVIALPAIADIDPIFAAIDDHRETYTAMEKAEDDYNADPERKRKALSRIG